MTNGNLGQFTTVVPVHAAWADASSWSKVIALLQRKGMQAVAAQIPLTSLADDVATLRRVLKRISGTTVLVGHSYGGAVITAAATANANVKAVIYVAAMAPDEDETVGQLLHRATPDVNAPALVPDEDGFLWMSAKGFSDAVAHNSSLEGTFRYSDNIAPARGMSYGGAIRILPNHLVNELDQLAKIMRLSSRGFVKESDRWIPRSFRGQCLCTENTPRRRKFRRCCSMPPEAFLHESTRVS